jgi:hypothetical protein
MNRRHWKIKLEMEEKYYSISSCNTQGTELAMTESNYVIFVNNFLKSRKFFIKSPPTYEQNKTVLCGQFYF